MDVDMLTLVFVCIVIIIGFYLNQVWLSLIFAFVLLAVLFSASKAKEPSATPAGPQVRPIIVKRKYVGPESIYPQKMKIRVTTADYGTGTPWYSTSGKKIGEAVAKSIRNIGKWFE